MTRSGWSLLLMMFVYGLCALLMDGGARWVYGSLAVLFALMYVVDKIIDARLRYWRQRLKDMDR